MFLDAFSTPTRCSATSMHATDPDHLSDLPYVPAEQLSYSHAEQLPCPQSEQLSLSYAKAEQLPYYPTQDYQLPTAQPEQLSYERQQQQGQNSFRQHDQLPYAQQANVLTTPLIEQPNLLLNQLPNQLPNQLAYTQPIEMSPEELSQQMAANVGEGKTIGLCFRDRSNRGG